MNKYVIAALDAYKLVIINGQSPEAAYEKSLCEQFKGEALKNAKKHTCPKWAFCGLCDDGRLKDVKRACCPRSKTTRSSNFALKTLMLLNENPSLYNKDHVLESKRVLKSKVFGSSRTPNDEVEVVLAFYEQKLTL